MNTGSALTRGKILRALIRAFVAPSFAILLFFAFSCATSGGVAAGKYPVWWFERGGPARDGEKMFFSAVSSDESVAKLMALETAVATYEKSFSIKPESQCLVDLMKGGKSVRYGIRVLNEAVMRKGDAREYLLSVYFDFAAIRKISPRALDGRMSAQNHIDDCLSRAYAHYENCEDLKAVNLFLDAALAADEAGMLTGDTSGTALLSKATAMLSRVKVRFSFSPVKFRGKVSLKRKSNLVADGVKGADLVMSVRDPAGSVLFTHPFYTDGDGNAIIENTFSLSGTEGTVEVAPVLAYSESDFAGFSNRDAVSQFFKIASEKKESADFSGRIAKNAVNMTFAIDEGISDDDGVRFADDFAGAVRGGMKQFGSVKVNESERTPFDFGSGSAFDVRCGIELSALDESRSKEVVHALFSLTVASGGETIRSESDLECVAFGDDLRSAASKTMSVCGTTVARMVTDWLSNAGALDFSAD